MNSTLPLDESQTPGSASPDRALPSYAGNAHVALASSRHGASITAIIDRWIYVFMAGLLVVTALAGFIPDSMVKLGAIDAGARLPFPPILHVHAVLMGAWLLLLLTQTTLMAAGRRDYHMKLGIASLLLAPAIVIAGIILIPTMFRLLWDAAHAPPPGLEAALADNLRFVTNIMLFQFRVGVLFAVFVTLALQVRKTDPGTHKRLMILATLLPLPAAIDRIVGIPTTLPGNPATIEIYTLLWMSPMFLWDLYRLRTVHRAYVIWFVAVLPFAVAAQLLWGTPWWMQTAPRLMGIPSTG